MLAVTGAQAQIFINTGNPNVDKYKQDNPNATMYEGAVTTDTTKVQTAVKTPPVKIVQPTETATPKKQATAPIAPITKTPATVNTTAAAKPAKSLPAQRNAAPPTADNNMPPNAEVGKCYARCYAPDQYETKTETVIDKPLSYKTKTIPATYKTAYDTLTVKAATVRYNQIAATYETVIEDVLVSPATQKWVKSTADAGCLSANPADCQVMCLREVPAVYKKVSRKIVKTPASRQEIPVPAEYKIIPKQVLDQPASQQQIEIPATYKQVSHKELVKKGGYSEWREILCASKLTTAKIAEIQNALKANGYNPGPIDNIFGELTKAALVKYQQDKNLPVGNLNIETLKSLGVSQ
jgi:hypothetical protein